MEPYLYYIGDFKGPLDLLLSLIQKNKVNITDIPIALICDQYMEYIRAAERMDLDIASEFIVMASELMLIKSKMLLPRPEPEEEDPRAALADALLKYMQAKEGAAKLAKVYPRFSGRMVKDTDEISVDKTFVADQSVTSLCLAVRRIIAYREEHPGAERVTFTPMIASPIVPVETKIVGILRHFEECDEVTLSDLIEDAVSLPDMIAIFLGVLELMKMRHILLLTSDNGTDGVLNIQTAFRIGDAPAEDDESPTPADAPTVTDGDTGGTNDTTDTGDGADSHEKPQKRRKSRKTEKEVRPHADHTDE